MPIRISEAGAPQIPAIVLSPAAGLPSVFPADLDRQELSQREMTHDMIRKTSAQLLLVSLVLDEKPAHERSGRSLYDSDRCGRAILIGHLAANRVP